MQTVASDDLLQFGGVQHVHLPGPAGENLQCSPDTRAGFRERGEAKAKGKGEKGNRRYRKEDLLSDV